MRFVSRIACLAVLAVLALSVSGAAAAVPDDLSADPLDRAALLALPSVYRVDVTIRVNALRGGDGERIRLPRAARVVREAGTAFAVAPDGWLATARHVARPEEATIARLAYQQKLIAEDRPHGDAVVDTLVKSIGPLRADARVLPLRVRPADPGGSAGRSDYRARRVEPSDDADVALIRIDAPGAPTLGLDDAASVGTPVVTIGFGSGGAFGGGARGELEPVVRRGTLGRSATLEKAVPQREVIMVNVPVQGGDSGAPVVDGRGVAHGIVVFRLTDGGVRRGLAEGATEIRQLLDQEGLTPGPDPAAAAFREAMGAFWNLDMGTAQDGFRTTLAAFPGHTLAPREAARAASLEDAGFRLEGRSRRRGALLALGIVASAVAAGFAIALLRSVSGDDRGAGRPAGRGGTGAGH
jgi:hypothetical protein